MPSLAAIRASNAAFAHSAHPVAVFVGGTSGIGEAMARAFAEHTKGDSDIVIVGRNRTSAERILAALPIPSSTSPTSDNGKLPPAREFVQCDVTVMKNIQDATRGILSKHSKINYLVMSPGIMTMTGRDETEEGIDKKLAVHYYGRWKFLHDLLPALKKANESGEEGAVMSVLGTGNGGPIDLKDLALKDGYTVRQAALVAPTYNDLMMESFSEQAPNLKFIQGYPGIVRTSLLASSSSWVVRASGALLLPLTRPFSVSAEECGEYMWNAIYKTATKAGPWRTGSKGEDLGKTRYFGDENQRKKLWDHTVEVMSTALRTPPSEGTEAGKSGEGEVRTST